MISLAHAQTAAASSDPTSSMMQFLPMILMFAVLWFLMVRPQMKKAKEHKALLAALQKGDEVVTQGGLAGRISKVGDYYMTLSIAEAKDGTVDVVVQKSAVTILLPKGTLKTL